MSLENNDQIYLEYFKNWEVSKYKVSFESNDFVGEYIDSKVENMGGVRYTRDGDFVGFLQPKRK